MTAKIIPGDYSAYEAADGMRQSDLKAFRMDPELFYARRFGKYPRPNGKHFEFGTNVEAYLRGDLNRKIQIIPTSMLKSNGTRLGSTNARWIEWTSKFQPGTTFATEREYESGQGVFDTIAKNVRENHAANLLINGPGRWNVGIQWTFEPTGTLMKTELDRVVDEHQLIADLKTAKDVKRKGFSAAAEDLGYWIQAYCQQQALAQVNGGEIWEHCFVVIRNEPAYSVRVRPLPDDWIAAAEPWMIETIEWYQHCERTGVWREKDWDDLETPLERPRWAWGK